MKDSDIEEKKYTYEKYFEERKLLIDAERESAQSFDKSMLALAGGALGLSITFIREIAPHPRDLFWLYISWGGFIGSLLSTMISFLSSQKSLRKQRENLEEWLRAENTSLKKNSWASLTSFLNLLSIFTLIIGVVALALFAVGNLN